MNKEKINIKKGDVFESWMIIDDVPVKIHEKKHYLCKCIKCNETVSYVRKEYLLKDDSYKCCKKCWTKDRDVNWENENERKYFCHIRGSAKSRNISFNLTPKYMFELLQKQEYKCMLTKEDISFDSDEKPSLDRINSSLGYIKGNVQWVRKRINFMKNELTNEEFINLCELVTKVNKKQKDNERITENDK